MWSPRAQSDRMLFSAVWRKELEKQKNLDFCQAMVSDLLIDNNKISGVVTSTGTNLYAKTVILTNGTFLNGLIHIGEKNYGGGRTGEQASFGITKSLERVGFSSGRMKTGTPPRVDGRSLDFSIMDHSQEIQIQKNLVFLMTPTLKKTVRLFPNLYKQNIT